MEDFFRSFLLRRLLLLPAALDCLLSETLDFLLPASLLLLLPVVLGLFSTLLALPLDSFGDSGSPDSLSLLPTPLLLVLTLLPRYFADPGSDASPPEWALVPPELALPLLMDLRRLLLDLLGEDGSPERDFLLDLRRSLAMAKRRFQSPPPRSGFSSLNIRASSPEDEEDPDSDPDPEEDSSLLQLLD